jgi:hypothetical protein
MTALVGSPTPAQSVPFEWQFLERRAERTPGKKPGAYIMDKAWPSQLLRADRAAGTRRIGLQDKNLETGSCQNACSDQTVGARANNDSIRIVRPGSRDQLTSGSRQFAIN